LLSMLERMAADIFAYHTAGTTLDASTSGAEWWVQRRERGDEEETIGWHWDKDEYAVDTYQINIHPHLSTVTYLRCVARPTSLRPSPLRATTQRHCTTPRDRRRVVALEAL
jgi:hypothetical protein